MKVKTSVTLEESLLQGMDALIKAKGHPKNRSAFIEEALRRYLAEARRIHRDERDRKLINESADRLNEEAADVLGYQVEL